MKLGQLIEYNIRNIFLEKSYTKCGGETIPRSFSRNSKLSKSLDQLSFKSNRWGLSKYIETNLPTPCFYLVKFFLKNKKRSETGLCTSLSAWYLKNIISLVILYWLTKFHCLVAFTSWDIGQCVYCNFLIARLWRHKFWS